MVATAALSVLLPLMMLTGLTMSPEWMRSCPGSSIYSADANPRGKSASAMVFRSGPINKLGSMITGRFVITVEDKHDLCSEVGMISINFKLYCTLYDCVLSFSFEVFDRSVTDLSSTRRPTRHFKLRPSPG
jgi:hypothetical protein